MSKNDFKSQIVPYHLYQKSLTSGLRVVILDLDFERLERFEWPELPEWFEQFKIEIWFWAIKRFNQFEIQMVFSDRWFEYDPFEIWKVRHGWFLRFWYLFGERERNNNAIETITLLKLLKFWVFYFNFKMKNNLII